MATETSSIDDVLLAQNKTALTPTSPEEMRIESNEALEQTYQEVAAEDNAPSVQYNTSDEGDSHAEQEAQPLQAQPDYDDYGNEKPAPKVYTEDEVNERINRAIRERMARLERNTGQQQPTQAQMQQAAQQGFTYNENNPESWEQQLETFVERTFEKINQRQAMQMHQQKEAQLQAEFESKFHQGMSKFSDYHQVVGSQPITDAMVVATRSMPDPASFLYAAAKRAPQELQRIATLVDPLAQALEMGKLEERMRQQRPTTKAPKPIGKIQEDAAMPYKNNKEPTIEELIARDAARKLAKHNQHKRK